MEAVSPDHSTISRFRTAMTESGLMDKLLKAFNKQLSAHHISIKEGVLIDASIVDSPHRPDGTLRITVADDREDTRSDDEKDEEEAYHKFLLQERKGTDGEARWVKKKVYRYDYKKHVLTNREGIIRQVITTPANRNDLKELIPLLREEGLPADTPVYADKGYATEGIIISMISAFDIVELR